MSPDGLLNGRIIFDQFCALAKLRRVLHYCQVDVRELSRASLFISKDKKWKLQYFEVKICLSNVGWQNKIGKWARQIFVFARLQIHICSQGEKSRITHFQFHD